MRYGKAVGRCHGIYVAHHLALMARVDLHFKGLAAAESNLLIQNIGFGAVVRHSLDILQNLIGCNDGLASGNETIHNVAINVVAVVVRKEENVALIHDSGNILLTYDILALERTAYHIKGNGHRLGACNEAVVVDFVNLHSFFYGRLHVGYHLACA